MGEENKQTDNKLKLKMRNHEKIREKEKVNYTCTTFSTPISSTTLSSNSNKFVASSTISVASTELTKYIPRGARN